MAFDIKVLNEKTSKGSLATLIIVCALLVVTAISLIIVVVNSKTTDKSTKLFESAFVQILEFNEQTNVYSKQEMAPDIISDLDAVIASYPNTTAGARAVFYKGYVYYSTEDCYVFYIENYSEKGYYKQTNLKYFLPKEYSDIYEEFIKTSNTQKAKWYTIDENGNKTSVNT